jgi:CBS domain-containing protein
MQAQMSGDYLTVVGFSNVQTFADEQLSRSGRRCFIVAVNGRPAGLITPHEVRGIPQPQWPYKTLSDVMRPWDQLHTVTAEDPVVKALEIMGRDDVNQIPVMLNGALKGMISRGHILRLIQTRAELGR